MANNAILIQGLIELHMKGEGGQQAVASMTKIVAQAKEVEKATGGMGDGFSKGAKQVGVFEAAVGSLGRTVAGYFAAGVLANFLRDSFIGFARTERQALAVENQIKSLGQSAQGAGFRQFITQLSATSGILDDDLVPAFQRALGAFKDFAVAQDIVTLASKFAAAGIGDVASNVDAIARFFQTGRTQGIAQFGINIKGAADGTLDLVEGLKQLRSAASSVGGGFSDAQAALNRWRNQLDAAKDHIGEGLAGITTALETAGRFWGEVWDESLGFGAVGSERVRKTQEGATLLAQLAAQQRQKAQQESGAADAKFAQEKANREKADAEQLAKDLDEKQKVRLDKIHDLETKSTEDLLKQQASFAEAGSQERINIELRLNAILEAEAIRNANAIGAKTLDIEKFFAGERARINASKGETGEAARIREDAAGFDPRAGFPEVEKAYKEHEAELVRIAKDANKKLDADWARSIALQKDLDQQRLQNNLHVSQQMVNALGGLFAKNKAFAIGMAIINTALGITEVWTDKSLSFYEKIAGTIVVAASGLAQIESIQSANQGGGSAPAGSAAQRTLAAAPTDAAPPPRSGADTPILGSTSIRMPSQMSSGSVSSQSIYIGNAFGDDRAMQKLAREVARRIRYDTGLVS